MDKTGAHQRHTQADSTLTAKTDLPLHWSRAETANTGNNEAHTQPDQSTLRQKPLAGGVIASSDLWSAAYREAVESLSEEIDIAALEGKNVAQLFNELEEIETGTTNESVFLRGLKRLRALEPALQNLKLALDLASPLAHLEPTARTVVGVVSSVTAVSLTLGDMVCAYFGRD